MDVYKAVCDESKWQFLTNRNLGLGISSEQETSTPQSHRISYQNS